MPVVVTARHMHHIGDIQEFAQAKGEALVRDFPTVEHVHVILNKEKHLSRVEVVVQAKHYGRIEAEDASENMRASIEAAFHKTEKQLRKSHEKVRDHHTKHHRLSIRTQPFTLEEAGAEQ